MHRITRLILSQTIICYGTAVILLFIIGNYKKACVLRLNEFPSSMGDYPMLLDQNSAGFSEKSVRDSIHYYKILKEAFPSSDQPYNMIGYCYAIDGNTNLAIKYFLEAKERNPERFWYDYNLGVLYYKNGDKEKALTFFNGIIQINTPQLIQSAILAPLSHLPPQDRQQYYKNALNFAVKIRNLSLQNMIKIYFDNQRYDEIMVMSLKESQDLSLKNKTVFLIYAGVSAYKAGQFNIALEFFKTALDQEPDQIWAKTFFILTRMHLEKISIGKNEDVFNNFLKDPEMFPLVPEKIILHPWSYTIQPGKEIYF